MDQTTVDKVAENEKKAEKKPLNKRWYAAIPLAVVSIAVGAAVYMPGVFLGGMMTDSCTGSNVSTIWQIWLVFTWPAVMLAAALIPPVLLVKNKAWKMVIIAMAAGLAVSVVWYLLWIPLLAIVC